jgi:hypothetical protein
VRVICHKIRITIEISIVIRRTLGLKHVCIRFQLVDCVSDKTDSTISYFACAHAQGLSHLLLVERLALFVTDKYIATT